MKILVRKTVIIAVIMAAIIFLIYKSNRRSIFQKDKIYIVFDAKEDVYATIDWEEFSYLFPEDFNPTRTIVDMSELSKLDYEQKLKWDSIAKNLFKYPRKIIETNDGIKKYSLSLNSGLAIEFKVLDEKEIEKTEINSLNIISVDSMIKLIPDANYSSSNIKSKEMKSFNKIEFNLIEVSENKASLIKVVPFVIEYN